MTVRVIQEMRKKTKAMQHQDLSSRTKRELVTDNSYRGIHKKVFIYESPDGGKTIYRRRPSYCDVNDVKIDESEQLQFNFNNVEDEVNE